MNLKSQRRMAAEILGVGENRIWINPDSMEEVSEAITKNDIRRLIKSKVIRKRRVKGTSRVRANKLKLQRIRKRRKGHGSRKGKKSARKGKKELWIKKIRALRKRLKELKNEGKLTLEEYWKFYYMAKGGFFRNVSHMELYLNKVKEEKVA